jgi:hypothetical protein
MLNDTNRTGVFIPDGSVLFGQNIVGSGSDGTAYWNVFNVEGENSLDAAIATYSTLADMLNDTNRTGTFIPDGSVLFGQNIVGSGSDGTAYWNVFNVEGENSLNAAIATYATLADMLNDTNRTDTFIPDGSVLFGQNIVGSGADILAQTEIPEPGTLGLIASGLLAAAYGRRRRNAAAACRPTR